MAMVQIKFLLDLVKMLTPPAKVEMVSSIGAVRNKVSPRMAKRTTADIST